MAPLAQAPLQGSYPRAWCGGGSAGPPYLGSEAPLSHLCPTSHRSRAPVTMGLGGGTLRGGVLLWVRAQQDRGGQVASTPLPVSCLHTPPTSQDLVSSPVNLGQKAKAACLGWGELHYGPVPKGAQYIWEEK